MDTPVLRILADNGFEDYLQHLQETLANLQDYWCKTGQDTQALELVRSGLRDSDPFVCYSASLAASVMLSDKSIYH